MLHNIVWGIFLVGLQLLLVFYLVGLLACGWTTVMKGRPGKFCFACHGLRWPWNY